MGCCQSSTTSTSPYESPRPSNPDASLPRDSSRAAITQSSRAIDAINGSSSRPNQRIRQPSPLARSPKNVSNMPPPWTRSHLEKEREAFFETRVTGRVEVWSALDVVCQLVRRGEVQEAQGILDALGCTCPTGKIARGRGRAGEGGRGRGGVYDERGAIYEIPEWVVSDPKDVVEDGDTAGAVEKDIVDADNDEDDDEDEDLKGAVAVSSSTEPKEPKGKGRAASPGAPLTLRARLSDRGSDVEVSIGSKQPVRFAIQQIREKTGVNRVRLVYMGKPMDEAKTLSDGGWRTGQVVNAFVFEGDEGVILKKAAKGR